MSQPGLNRGLIVDLLDKLRNPGKGAPVGEIEDEEPEVRDPPPTLLTLFPCLEHPLAASLRRKKASEDGELGTGLEAQRLWEGQGLQAGPTGW